VATTTKDIYGGRDPRDVPTYSIKDAARFLIIPSTTLHSWVTGQTYLTQREGKKRARPVIEIAAGRPPQLSFWNLAEAYVSGRHSPPSRRVPPKHAPGAGVRRRKLGHKRPLIEQDFRPTAPTCLWRSWCSSPTRTTRFGPWSMSLEGASLQRASCSKPH